MDDIIDAMIIVIEHLCNSVIPPFFENTYLWDHCASPHTG